MPRTYPSYPSVSGALKSVRSVTFRGTTVGKADAYNMPTDEEIEMAASFDVSKALASAREARLRATQKSTNNK